MPQESHGWSRPNRTRHNGIVLVVSRRCFAVAAVVLFAMMATMSNAGCTGGSGSGQAEPVVSAEEAAEPTSVPTVVLTPVPSPARASGNIERTVTRSVPTNTPEITPTPRQPTRTPIPQPTQARTPELSADDVYAQVAPSVAMVISSVGSGSGVLLEGGYLVTNHHVVWADRWVRVLFPNGSDFGRVPVVAVDPLADVALLGPVETTAPRLRFSDGENLPVGSEVFLLGYPGEVDVAATPTIVSGVLSKFRWWQQSGITYLQTDASIAGGQSGRRIGGCQGKADRHFWFLFYSGKICPGGLFG